METLVTFTSRNFQTEVLSASTPVLVYFTSPWSAPCRMLTPIIQQLANEWTGLVKVGTCDIYDSFSTTIRYTVMKAPTLMLFIDGRIAKRVTGFRTKIDLESMFGPLLEAHPLEKP